MDKIFDFQDLKNDKITFLKVEWEGMTFLIKRGTTQDMREMSKYAVDNTEEVNEESVLKNIELMKNTVFNKLYTIDLKPVFTNKTEVDEIPFSFIKTVFEMYSEQ